MNKLFLLVLIALTISVSCNASRDRNQKSTRLVCYFGSWAHWRPGNGKMNPEDIDAQLCTHLVYEMASLDRFTYKMKVYDPDIDIDKGNFQKFLDLRKQNPHLTALISVGGWGDGSLRYSRMVDADKRKTFLDSVLTFLQKYDFDGLSFDWLYPGMKEIREGGGWWGNPWRVPSGIKADKPNYTQLLRELKEAFEPFGYVLAARVSAVKSVIDDGYEVSEIYKYLDFIHLMTFDFHGTMDWGSDIDLVETGHNAPLYIDYADNETNRQLTVEFAVDYWLRLGADPKKLVMGLTFEGKSFEISDVDRGIHTKTIPGSHGGDAGPYTQTRGILGFHEYCESRSEWTEHWVEAAGVPYAVKGDNWFGFDNTQSLKLKVDFLKSRGLGGPAAWSIEMDDLKGACGERFPLLNAINEALFESQGFQCKEAGYFADPQNSAIYHQCVRNGKGGFTDYVFNCPLETVFDNVIKNCVRK